MRLLRAELNRLFARRFTKLMLLAVVIALGVVAAVTAVNTHQPTPDDLRRAEVQAQNERARCEQGPYAAEEPDARIPADEFGCDDITAATFLPYLLDFRREMPGLLLLFFGFLAMFGYLVGASFLGAEWSSGGMANLLLWRTGRIRVLLGKVTALLTGVFLSGLVVAAGWTAGIWTIARYRGTVAGITGDYWPDLAMTGARGMGLALLATTVGAAIASLGRRTAAALGVLIGYLVVWEIGARIVMEALAVPGADRFVLSSYGVALLTGEYRVFDYRSCFDGICTPLLVITWWLGAAVLGGVTLLALLAATVSFRRRDIA